METYPFEAGGRYVPDKGKGNGTEGEPIDLKKINEAVAAAVQEMETERSGGSPESSALDGNLMEQAKNKLLEIADDPLYSFWLLAFGYSALVGGIMVSAMSGTSESSVETGEIIMAAGAGVAAAGGEMLVEKLLKNLKKLAVGEGK